MDDRINSIIQGAFEIDLIEIILTKGETCITGKGVIYKKNEELKLKFFNEAHITNESKMEESFPSNYHLHKTRILTEEDYYILSGKDQNGNTYECKIHAFFVASEIIEGTLSSDLIKINETGTNLKTNTLEVYVNDNGPIPLNDPKSIHVLYGKSEIQSFDNTVDDAWFFNVLDKYKIQVQRNDNYQRIFIETKYDIKEDEIDKLLNSLRFVLGRHFNWFYINYNFGNKEKYNLRRNSVFKNTIFKPPLKINRSYDAENYEKLFNCYYLYLSKENEQARKLNFSVRKTIIAGYAYLGAFELVLATSIEGILKIFKTEININTAKTEDDVKKIWKCLETFEEGNKVRNRVGGLLNNIKEISAKDILKKLVSTQKLENEYQNKYKKFRNSLAHADEPTRDTVKRLNELNGILVLFYHLIFLQIGYNGKYTNYFNDEVEDFTKAGESL